MPPTTAGDDGPPTAEMRFRGARVKVKLTSTHISWKPVNPRGCCVDRRSLTKQVPLDEVLSALALPRQESCCCPREHCFVVYGFSRRSARDPNTWRPEEYVLCASSPEQVKEWVGLINGRVQHIRDRPRSLLVFINPYAGARLARLVWEREVLPVFQRARIAVHVVETNKQDHARDVLELMKSEELAGYQGVVAVGGDGLFQEVVSGLLARRARGDSTAYRIRVGHIPAGSTDAVAYTLHGSRSASTAALHIALGDRLSLDAGRVAAADGSVRHFVCQAGYGFMGDVMRFSERLRFMGPSRYDVTGALQYLRLASYRVSLSYREATSTTADVQQLCTAQCEVCRMAGISMGHATPYYQAPSASAVLVTSTAAGSGMVTAGVGGGATGNTALASLSRGPLPVSTAAVSSSFNPGAIPTIEATAVPGSPSAAQGSGGGSSWHAATLHPSLYNLERGSPNGSGSGLPLYTTGRQLSAPVSQASASSGGVPSPAMPAAPAAACQSYEPPSATLERVFSAPSSPGQQQQQQQDGSVAGLASAAPAAGPGVSGAGAAGGSSGPGGIPPTAAAAAGRAAREDEGWMHVEGEFVSIMCVVTPCRSDKSKRGIIPNGHLSDGRMYLVLVEKCSHVSFLRFLVRLSTRGLADLCLPFVRVIPVTALRLNPLPGGHRLGGCLWDAASPESAWNVDGELLSCSNVDISVMRGALEVFARGPETTAAGAGMGGGGGGGGSMGLRRIST